MANGKIIYTPQVFVCVVLDGAHYLSLDSGDFNFGSADFAVDALLWIDPAVADSECWIAAKGAADLSSAAGWHWYYKPGSRRLGLRLNDGGLTPTEIETADNQIPALGTWFWARVEADRDGQARFFVDGADVGGGVISGADGSLDNAEPLKAGGYDASTKRHKGVIGLLRFDGGRLLPAAWRSEEWDRLRYGCPRECQDFLAVWTFANSLIDLSAQAYELAWGGSGSAAFQAGYPDGPIEYMFEDNFEFGHEVGRLDLDDRQRMADASNFTYPHPNQKKTILLEFKAISLEQQAALVAAWAGKQPVSLYLDTDRPETAQVTITTFPLEKSVFGTRVDAHLDTEEV